MNPGSERSIPRSLGLAMAVQFAVGGAVMPFISILLRDRGMNFSEISRILLASSSTLLFFPFLWGMLADRFIPMNRLFTLLNLLAVGSLAWFAAQKTFLGLLVGFTLFYACFNPTLTLINALSFRHLSKPHEEFGALRAWGSLGWMVPSLPVFLWLAGARKGGLDFVLDLGIALSLAMAGVTLFLPHTPPGTRESRAGSLPKLAYWPALKRLLRDPNYLAILMSFFLMAASFSILVFYSPPFLEDLGIDRAWIGPVQCIGVLFEIVLFRWPPRFIGRLSYSASILLGALALLLRHALFVISDNPWVLSGSYLLAAMVIVFYYIGISILVNAIASREVKATAQTLLVILGSGLGPMFGNWVAGNLAAANANSLQPVFLFAAGLAALAGLVILARGSRLNQAGRNPD